MEGRGEGYRKMRSEEGAGSDPSHGGGGREGDEVGGGRRENSRRRSESI